MVLLRNVGSKKSDRNSNIKTVRFDDSWQNTFKGTNGSGIKYFKKYRKCTSCNVTVDEVALEKGVIRISLIRYKLNDLKAKLRSKRSILKFERSLKAKRKLESSSPSVGRNTVNLNGISKRGTIVLSKNTKVTSKRKGEKIASKGNKLPDKSREVSQKNRKVTTKTEEKIVSSVNKLPNKSRDVSQKNRTLHRTIQKSDRNKFKIRLFPRKKSEQSQAVDKFNKSMDKSIAIAQSIPYHLNYFLQFKHYKDVSGAFSEGKLNYKFQKLVTDVKEMKLPSPTWKIKVIIRQNKIYAVTFTNKMDLERSVSFTSENDNYKIVIDNEQAFLLGSPGAVNNAQDIEILLDIVENIGKQDPMVLYK